MKLPLLCLLICEFPLDYTPHLHLTGPVLSPLASVRLWPAPHHIAQGVLRPSLLGACACILLRQPSELPFRLYAVTDDSTPLNMSHA